MSSFNALLDKFEVPPATKQMLGDAGIVGQVMPKAIKLVKGGEVVDSMPCHQDTVESILNGSATNLVQKATKDSLLKMISKVAMAATSSPLHEHVVLPGGEQMKYDSLPPSAIQATPGYATEIYPLDQIGSGSKVKLVQATKLYQPVHGSDSGSKYFALAFSPKLKMAARWKNSKLSVRFEGDVGLYSSELQAAGVAVHGDYASVHVNVETQTQGRKAIGALMVGISAGWTSPIPEPGLIYGKGN